MRICLNIIINKDKLYDKIIRYKLSIISFINDITNTLNRKWRRIFVNDKNNNLIELLKIIQCFLSISMNNSYVKGIFLIINNILNDDETA